MGTILTRKLDEMQPGLRDEITVNVTTEQVNAFAGLSGDISPLHVDPEFARARGYPGPVAHGLLIGAFISQLIGTRLPGANGLLQSCDLEFRKPLCPPAEIRICGEVSSKSAGTGQVTLQVKVYQGQDTLVAQAKVKTIVRD